MGLTAIIRDKKKIITFLLVTSLMGCVAAQPQQYTIDPVTGQQVPVYNNNSGGRTVAATAAGVALGAWAYNEWDDNDHDDHHNDYYDDRDENWDQASENYRNAQSNRQDNRQERYQERNSNQGNRQVMRQETRTNRVQRTAPSTSRTKVRRR